MPLEFPAWDPVLLELPGVFAVRWYGLMYLVGFVVGHWTLQRLIRIGFLPMAPERVGDLIFYLVLGVIVGGRLGHVLFYQFPAGQWDALYDPIKLIAIWEGGLAFHGGLIGVTVAVVLFARRAKVPILRLGDAVAVATCPGILAVRIANFINGELYGRVTAEDTFGAMRFPTDPAALRAFGLDAYALPMRTRELGIQVAVGHREWESVASSLPEKDGRGADVPWESIKERLDWDAVKDVVPFRHPSQLYEGIGEGLLLGIALWILLLRTRVKPLAQGAYFGVFLLGYGVVRSLLENIRQPDSQFKDANDDVGTVALGLTMGQWLSFGMLVAGALLIGRIWFSSGGGSVEAGGEPGAGGGVPKPQGDRPPELAAEAQATSGDATSGGATSGGAASGDTAS